MTEEEPIPSGFPGAWYVQFHGDEVLHWWDMLSPPGFYHVLAFAYAEHAERWLIYDVGRDRTLIRALDTRTFAAWLSGQPKGRRILLYEAGDRPARPAHRIGFWCTIAVSHLIGLRSRALRPFALYRELLAQGARPAFEEPSLAVPESSHP